MSRIHIEFTRFSAFYTPLIATISGGFLEREGLEPTHSVTPHGRSAIDSLKDGSAHVVQSALSQGLLARDRGETPAAVHFAQINEMDGFFLAGREADPAFAWDKLGGAEVLVDHGGQPLAMFRYACHKRGVAFEDIEAVDAGDPVSMVAAFKAGAAHYVHLQGPAPQQIEHEGAGFVVASVGEAIGRCGFSSLAATAAWLETGMANAFMRAYRGARAYVNEAPAAEIAAGEEHLFPEVAPSVLTATISAYQSLGCWSPHVEITRAAFEATVDIFTFAGGLKQRHRYEDVCAMPPSAA